MSALPLTAVLAHDLLMDTIRDHLERRESLEQPGLTLKCLHCCRPRQMCICLEFCEECAEAGDVCDDCWDSGRGRDQ